MPRGIFSRVCSSSRCMNAMCLYEAYVRTKDGKLFGKPSNGIASKYLSTGLMTCGVCGGSFSVRKSGRGALHLRCLSYVQHGPRGCRVHVALPEPAIIDLVLTMYETQVLDERVILAAVDEAVRRLHADTNPAAQREALPARLTEITGECRNLAVAIAKGGTLTTLMETL